MSRRRASKKRDITPDGKFGDVVVAKFMQCLMVDGKKSVAERIVYGAMDKVDGTANRTSLSLFLEAIDNVKPILEVKSRRVGGATYQVPVEVAPNRARTLSFRWIIGNARKRTEKTMVERLAGEILDAVNNKGASVKKREDTHKMAEANKVFAHFKW